MGGTLQNGEIMQRFDMKDPSGAWVMNTGMTACQRA